MRITIRAARVNAGLTQAECAEKMGISRSALQSWEDYKTSPQFEYAERFSALVGMPLECIIFSRESRLKRSDGDSKEK